MKIHKVSAEVNSEDFEFLKEQCERFFPNRRVDHPNVNGHRRPAKPSASYMVHRIVEKWIRIQREKQEGGAENVR